MRMNGVPKRGWSLAFTATILTTIAIAGCGTSTVPAPGTDAKAVSTPKTTQDENAKEEQPTQSRPYDGTDVPTDVPQPIPQPAPPADPKALNVRAVANTVNSSPLKVFSASAPTTISVYATLTWSKCQNAAQYRVSRNDDPNDKDEKGNPKFYVRSNVPASYRGYQDGGVLQRLKTQNKYTYLVEALDSSGNVIAKGQDDTTPLYPLAIPTTTAPENNKVNASIAPEFKWSSVAGTQCYYVEVYSGVYFTPMWRGYRSDKDGTNIKYGEQVEENPYPGTTPAFWAMILQPQGYYTWSVTAVKTDTGNALTAKAWAKSNSSAWRFYCGAKPATGGN